MTYQNSISGYDLVKGVPDNILSALKEKPNLDSLLEPFSVISTEDGIDLFKAEDIAFINTSQLNESARHFKKYGTYTNAHPIYDRKEYEAFWDEEERRCKEGLVVPGRLIKDKDGSYHLQKIHITGEHYGYLNYAQIKRLNAQQSKGGLVSANGEPLTKTQSGSKEIDFPDFWDGDYFFFKAVEVARKIGKHIVVGKARRKGYSYKNGWLAANRANLYRNTTTLVCAFSSDSLYPEGTMSMADNYLQWIAKNTDWSKRRLIDRENFIKFGYKYNDSLGIERGYLSKILAASIGPNHPGVARGKDSDFVLVEESGKNPLLADFLSSTLPTLRAGALVTGLMVVFGTGGGKDVLWEAFEDLFYNPYAQDFMAFDNVWDEGESGTQCGFFVPSFINKEPFIDKYGNSDIKSAIDFEEGKRAVLRKSGNPKKLDDHTAEEPFTPKEAFSRSSTSIFPAADFDAQLKRVQRDPDIKGIMRVGNLVRSNKGVIFKDKLFADSEDLHLFKEPITKYPLPKHMDVEGSFVMWSPPFKVNGVIPSNLYRIWHDPYAINKDKDRIGSRDSLGCTYVYERGNNMTPGLGDRIVAMHIGRFNTTDEYNELLFKIADYYNAEVLIENDRGDVFNYAKNNQLLHVLVDEPEILWKKALQGKSIGTGRKKGIHINDKRKADGVVYLRDWFMTKRGKDDFGNEVLNLHLFYDEGGLMEALKWNMKNNFDRISTLIVGMYDIREQFFTEISVDNYGNKYDYGNGVFERDWF